MKGGGKREDILGRLKKFWIVEVCVCKIEIGNLFYAVRGLELYEEDGLEEVFGVWVWRFWILR